MPNSPAADIAQYIVDNDIGTLDLNDKSLPLVRVGMEPDVERRVLITVYDTPGPPSNPAWQRDFPNFQIRVKADTEHGYANAYSAQQKVKDLLLGMGRVVINNTLYIGVWQQTDIASLSSDYNKRNVLVANYKTAREYETPNRKKIQ